MATVTANKIIGNGSKPCNNCGKTKHYSEFYVRSTFGTPDKPAVEDGHFVSECKTCVRERGRKNFRLPPWESRVQSEQVAIDYLLSRGIWATTGKMTSAPDVDLTAWGVVWVEVKHARLDTSGSNHHFQFNFTPAQQKRGVLAHVIMLLCEWPDGHYTYHLFDADAPMFYKDDGSLKYGVVYNPDRYEPSNKAVARGNSSQLTVPLMESAQDYTDLIEEWRATIHELLAEGVKPEYGVPLKP